jgi:hypothetical protein
MMKRIILITITLAFAFLIHSCYYDSEEALYPNLDTTCDTNNVTFSVTITTMLSENCYSCHSNSTAASVGGNIKLQDYVDVAAQSTSLANAIQHTGSVTPMPKNGGKVSDCAINQFNIWIRQGKLNN